MKKTAEQPQRSKQLILHKETLRLLTQPELLQIEGGVTLKGCGGLFAAIEQGVSVVPPCETGRSEP